MIHSFDFFWSTYSKVVMRCIKDTQAFLFLMSSFSFMCVSVCVWGCYKRLVQAQGLKPLHIAGSQM